MIKYCSGISKDYFNNDNFDLMLIIKNKLL